MAHALARLLATAPDASVRDGARAKAIVEELLKGQKTTDLGETMAMTLAELGEYSEAAAVQREIIAAAGKAGLHDAVQRMARIFGSTNAASRIARRGDPTRSRSCLPIVSDRSVHASGIALARPERTEVTEGTVLH